MYQAGSWYPGFRISDVGLFNMNSLKGTDVFSGDERRRELFAHIPDRSEIDSMPGQSGVGVRPFVVGHSDRL